jgi:hypothetical protein
LKILIGKAFLMTSKKFTNSYIIIHGPKQDKLSAFPECIMLPKLTQSTNLPWS